MSRMKKIKQEFEEPLDQTVYSEEERKDMVENDELTPLEEAFMMGWEEADAEEEVIEEWFSKDNDSFPSDYIMLFKFWSIVKNKGGGKYEKELG